jgi:hypothetical protein
MTAQLPASRARRRGPVPEPLPETGPGKSPRVVRRRPGWIAAWPITALLVLYPLWWALGLADYMPVLLALPMAARMYAWRHSGSRRILFPPGFPLWLLFLLCTAVSALALPLNAPDTIVSSVANRTLSFGQRGIVYLGITVLLIYAGNLTEKELPRRRLAWMLGLIGVYAIVGGVAAMLAPHFQFIPAWLRPRSLSARPAGGRRHRSTSPIPGATACPWCCRGWSPCGARRPRDASGCWPSGCWSSASDRSSTR